MPISRGMDGEGVVHIHSGIVAIKKTGLELVLVRCMNLEPVVQSEVSQREKHILYISVYMESKNMVLMNLFAGKDWRSRCREWTCKYRRRNENGMNGESSINVCTLPSVKQIAGKKVLYNTESPAWLSSL